MNDLLRPNIRPFAAREDMPLRAPQASPGFEVQWARHASEVREAQRLRHRIFSGEMGAQLRPLAGSPVSGVAPVVTVLDSGYTPHPELDPHWVLPGYDFVCLAAYANDGNGQDNDALDPGDRLSAAEAASAPALWDG